MRLIRGISPLARVVLRSCEAFTYLLEVRVMNMEVSDWISNHNPRRRVQSKQVTGKFRRDRTASSALIRKSLRIFGRYIQLTAIALTLLGSLLVIAACMTPDPTHFLLNNEQTGIQPTRLAPWHEFSDWVHGRKHVVLTFDDGPVGTDMDKRFIAILHKHHAHAIFFLVCSKIVPESVTVISTLEHEGHMIGNHSTNHLRLDELPYPEASREIESCSSRIAGLTGHRPHYFRPPFGRSSPLVEEAARVSGMQALFWNASDYDYLYRDPSKVLQVGSEQVPDMAVLLMHERKITEEVLDQILTRLEQRGFTFVLPEA